MAIWLEEKIKDALLCVRWGQVGKGTNPEYFTIEQPNYAKMDNLTATWLAKFIAYHVINNTHESNPTDNDDSTNNDFDKYSLEIIASYLEDHGYTVYFPD